MARQLKQGRLTVEVIYETDDGNFPRTRLYAIAMEKGAFAHGKNGNFAVQITENGKQVGIDINGDPSEGMLDLMDEIFIGGEEEVASA